MPRYAFVGNDTVGAYIARCLAPLGWKHTEDAADADMVFTYCTSAGALEDAYFEDGGLIKRSHPGMLLIDLSPCAPSFSREIAAVAALSDLRPVEAPLSIVNPALPDAFASPDNVMCFVAGEADDVDEAIDVIETIAGVAVRTGGSGSAQLAKAMRVVQEAALITSAVESDALARMVVGQATSPDCENHAAAPMNDYAKGMLAAVKEGAFEGSYTIEMLMGEVEAAVMAAEDVGLILPMLESTAHLLEIVAVIGGASKSPAMLSMLYRDEQDGFDQGLDWSRAEHLFDDFGYYDDDLEDDFDLDYEDEDEFGFYGSFGGYSSN